MGDLSSEPSMEEILSSIKRIIAEEGEGAPARTRRGSRPIAPPPEPPADEEVLELSDPMPPVEELAPMPRAVADPVPQPTPRPAPAAAPVAAATAEATAVSTHTAHAVRGAFDQLSRLMVKPEAPSDGTLEGLVREMLRPMLQAWLDTNLQPIVEDAVQREMAKILDAR